MTDSLQELKDKQALHDLLMRYCRGIDRADVDLIASVFHPDAEDNHGTYRGGTTGFIEWWLPRRERYEGSMHCILNEYFVIDGDVAYGESYFVASGTTTEEGLTFLDLRPGRTDEPPPSKSGESPRGGEPPLILVMTGGRYLDRFERRRGEWRIAHRQVVREWGPSFSQSEAFSQVFLSPGRDHSDPSYDVLNGKAYTSGAASR